jgi:hypothetical protein
MAENKITSATYSSFNTKGFGAVNYNNATYKKDGTIYVSYGTTGITFSTVTDYLIFINEVIVPLTNTVHSVSHIGADYVPINPGAPSSVDAVTD